VYAKLESFNRIEADLRNGLVRASVGLEHVEDLRANSRRPSARRRTGSGPRRADHPSGRASDSAGSRTTPVRTR
jgi:hypothetical protein